MVGKRRVALIWAVGQARESFSREKREVVKDSFQVVGLALPIDRSEDHRLSIKGLATDLLVEGLENWENEVPEREIDINIDMD